MSRLLGGTNAHKASSDLLSVNFNQDASCVAVGTRSGYSITNCEPFGKVYSKNVGPVSIVEMLFCTSLVAIVGTADSGPSASPRRLQIVNTKRQSTICELLFPTTILAVKLNRRRLVVVLEDEIYIYDISNMKLLHTIETSPNPNAICALSPSSDPCYLAYPSPVPSPTSPFAGGGQGGAQGAQGGGAGARGGSSSNASGSSSSSSSSSNAHTPGDVLIFDLLTLSVTNIIQAHKSPIAHLSLNSTGTLLATASDKGTVLRVFSVPAGGLVGQYRRGAYPARIYSMQFNAVSSLLAVSSDTETVHIFKVAGQPGQGQGGQIRGGGLGGAGAAGGGGALDSPSLGSEDGSSENGSTAGAATPSSTSKGNGGGFPGSLRRRTSALASRLTTSSSHVATSYLLPSSLRASLWDPQRDFASLRLPTPGASSVVAVSGTSPQVFVATSEGYFYVYGVDLEKGGEAVLLKQFSLLEGGGEGAGEGEGGDGEGQA